MLEFQQKTVSDRLDEIGVALSDIDAILITHEHTDHIKGLSSLAMKHKIPVFANSDTAKAIIEILGEAPKFKIFSTGETFEFGDIDSPSLSIQHDTLDPLPSRQLNTTTTKLGFARILVFATTLLKNHLKNCNYLYIEANHQLRWSMRATVLKSTSNAF
jgi:phosphoribosyl 1,2-cyclic phosphodiesterase